MRIAIVLVPALLATACSCADPPASADGGSDAAVDGSVDALDAAPDAPPDAGRCIAADVAATWALVELDDTSILYRVRITPDVGGRPFDLFLWFQRYGDTQYVGEFPLGEAADANFGSCAHCVMSFYGLTWDRGFFADAGTLVVRHDPFTQRLDLTLRDVRLIEVEIVPDGEGVPVLVSRPVEDGLCITLPETTVQRSFPPPEWRCEHERFYDGTTCDCECGAFDPDCGVLELPTRGCAAGEVCAIRYPDVLGGTAEGTCMESCDGRACGSGSCTAWFGGLRVCLTDPDLVADADVGEPCGGEGGWTFCAEADGVIGGVCDGTCRAACDTTADCSAAAFERCLSTFGRLDAPFGTEEEAPGYCVPRYPPDWTCSGGDYEDGAICHCGCGAWDIDCGDVADVRTAPIGGCASGETCVLVDENGLLGATECVVPPSNDTCATAAPLVLGTTHGTSRGAMNHSTPAYGEGACVPSRHYGFDVVYAIDLAAGDRLIVDATPTDFDLSLYLVGPGAPSICEVEMLPCAAVADAERVGVAEHLEHTATAAGTHYLVIDSYFPRSGPFVLETRVE